MRPQYIISCWLLTLACAKPVDSVRIIHIRERPRYSDPPWGPRYAHTTPSLSTNLKLKKAIVKLYRIRGRILWEGGWEGGKCQDWLRNKGLGLGLLVCDSLRSHRDSHTHAPWLACMYYIWPWPLGSSGGQGSVLYTTLLPTIATL